MQQAHEVWYRWHPLGAPLYGGRLLSLEERGFLQEIVDYIACNGSAPLADQDLARILRLDPRRVRRLLPKVARYFTIEGDELRMDLRTNRKGTHFGYGPIAS